MNPPQKIRVERNSVGASLSVAAVTFVAVFLVACIFVDLGCDAIKRIISAPSTATLWTISVFATLAAVATPLAAAWWMYVNTRWQEIEVRSHQCHECGYDLTGNVSGVCPECGTAVD